MNDLELSAGETATAVATCPKMTEACEELLTAIQSENNDFVKLIARNSCKADSFDIGEVVEFMNGHQLSELWQLLHTKCSSALLNFSQLDTQDEDAGPNNHISVLQGVVVVATATISCQETVPQMLFEAVALLHGILLLLPERYVKLQNSIVNLCELWWLKKIAGREELVSQAISVLIQKNLMPNASKSDVKRLWKIHEMLAVVEWNNSDSDALKQLLLQFPRTHSVMGCEQGRKFLGYLFGLNDSMMGDFHSTIKDIIPFATSATLDWFGEVYFNAWQMLKKADTDLLEKFEKACLQDLMYSGVHAPRVVRHGAPRSLSASLYNILSYLHGQKMQKGVDSMLYQLYKPFLWRSLKVANADVRANAASLFFNAFPFVDDSEGDDLWVRQIETAKMLLDDKGHVVRCVAVKGICEICTSSWELLSSDYIKAIASVLVQKLAWDASSADVRLAVIKGFEKMIGNSLTHPFLLSVLPCICNLFHDVTDKVRLGMVDLLLHIKGLKSIKFWAVVPMDHILARLEIEQSTLRLRLVRLVFESFMPAQKPLDVQLERCIYLWRANAGAARNFYLNTYRHLDLPATCNFILYILKFVMSLVLRNRENTEASIQSGDLSNENTVSNNEATSSLRPDGETNGEIDAALEANDEIDDEANDEDELGVSITDENLIAGLFETVAMLWMGVNSNLKEAELDLRRKHLQAKAALYLPTFIRAFDSPRVNAPLFTIAGFIPPTELRTVSCSMVSKLRAFTTSSDESEYGCLLEMMCQWKKGSDVLELISDWLQPSLVPESANKKRSGHMVRFADPVPSNPQMALRFLAFLMDQSACQVTLLQNNRPSLRLIADCLKKIQDVITRRLASNDRLGEPLTDDVLVTGFQRRLRLEVLLHLAEKTTNDLMQEVEDVLSWASLRLLSALKTQKSGSNRSRRGHRLANPSDCTMIDDPMEMEILSQTALQSQTLSEGVSDSADSQSSAIGLNPRAEFASCLIKSLLNFGINSLSIGVCNNELASLFGEFSISLLRLDAGIMFLPLITQLLSAVMRLTHLQEAGYVGEGHYADVTFNVLKEILNTCLGSNQMRQERVHKVIAEARNSLEEVLLAFFERAKRLSKMADLNDLMDTIITTIIRELQIAITKDPMLEPRTSFKGLLPLSAVLVHAVFGKIKVASVFYSRLEVIFKSDVIETVEGLASCTHMLNVLICSTGISKCQELKRCSELLGVALETFTLPGDTADDSPLRSILSASVELLSACRMKLNPRNET